MQMKLGKINWKLKNNLRYNYNKIIVEEGSLRKCNCTKKGSHSWNYKTLS